MTQFQLRDYAEESPDKVIVIILVTPAEAAILLLANGVRQGIGVGKVNALVMHTLKRLKFLVNIGGKAGRTARHQFTPKAIFRLRFAKREFDEVWIALEESDNTLESSQWRSDLELIAGELAYAENERYEAEQADWLASRRH